MKSLRLFAVLVLVLKWVSSAQAGGGPGYAINFDGIDDRVQAGPNLFGGIANSFTIELWARPTGARTATTEMNSGISDINQRFAIAPDHGDLSYGANHVCAGLSIGTNGISVFESAVNHLPSTLVYAVSISNWTHVALVYNGGQPRIYVNGVLARMGVFSSMTFVHPSANLAGTTNLLGYGPYQGQLDEVRIWNSGLSQSQIQANMNRSLTGSESGLVAYYRCDEGSGPTTADSAPAIPVVTGTLASGAAFVISGVQPGAPIVATLPASALLLTSAVLNGVANPEGTNTTAWFEWGATTNYGNTTPAQAIGGGTGNTNFSQSLSNLTLAGTYHFRATASNCFGLAQGIDQSFTTPVFADINAGLPGVAASSAAWGDYDNDGRLDVLLTGVNTNDVRISQVWRNTGSSFTNINAGLRGVANGSVAWGDCDNDGRLDILLAGSTNGAWGASFSQVWRNTGSSFTNINAGLQGVFESSVAWGDYDNDGRLDILLSGANTNGIEQFSQVWRNTGTGFTNINAGLPGAFYSSVAWGDYDNDGQLDILLTGMASGSQVWRNLGYGFANPGFTDVFHDSAAWGDYDNDGRLDMLLTGTSISQLWRNTGSGFTNVNTGLPKVGESSVAWGDYDNDGRLDILLTGADTNGVRISQVWRNTGSGFANINAGLTGVYLGSAAWGDYDNDGRLDILLTGTDTNGVRISQVWKNYTAVTNTLPTLPSGLSVTVTGIVATLSWNAASDSQTPSAGLSYNLRIGTTPGSSDILAPSSAASGLRRLSQLGNAQQGLTAVFNYTVGVPYYWSVQAVDGTFAGSPFAAEGNFKILSPAASVIQAQATNQPPGDVNGDGIVNQSELAVVLASFWSSNPRPQMQNVAGLGGADVSFALTNFAVNLFSSETSTNLTNWQFLGPITVRYGFTDTNPPGPQRFYRLRWP